MAKGTTKRRSATPERDPLIRGTSGAARGTTPTNTPFDAPVFTSYPRPVLFDYGPLSEVSDLRRYDPATLAHPGNPPRIFKPARTLLGAPARFEVPAKGKLSTIAFQAPKTVAICVRRHQRREVLHALKQTGRGSGHGKKHRNPWSSISCKR